MTFDLTKLGWKAYYYSVFALLAFWGVDFVKVDDLSRPYCTHAPARGPRPLYRLS